MLNLAQSYVLATISSLKRCPFGRKKIFCKILGKKFSFFFLNSGKQPKLASLGHRWYSQFIRGSLGVHDLGVVSAYTELGLTCESKREYCGNDGVWLLRLKDIAFFFMLSWVSCSTESQLPCHEDP